MLQTERKEKMDRLQSLLATMDIPLLRKEDLRWLRRNLAINNNSNPLLPEALSLLRQLNLLDA